MLCIRSTQLVVVSLCSALLLVSASIPGQNYSEDLFVKHLPDGRVMATFDFITTWDINPVTFAQPSLGMPHAFGTCIYVFRFHL